MIGIEALAGSKSAETDRETGTSTHGTCVSKSRRNKADLKILQKRVKCPSFLLRPLNTQQVEKGITLQIALWGKAKLI